MFTHEKKTILRSVSLVIVVLFAWNSLGIAHSSPEIPSNLKSKEKGHLPFLNGVMERVKAAASTTPIPESADAVLIRTKEWQIGRAHV